MLMIFLSWLAAPTTAEAKLLVEPRNRSPQGTRVSERSKIAGAIVFFQARQDKAWPWIRGIDLCEKEALVIPEADVVPRSILLDELAFEQKCLLLIADQMYFEIPYGVEESPGFVIGSLLSRGHEVVPQPLAQVTGFSHVDDRAKTVQHEVDSRLMRDVPEAGSHVRTRVHFSTVF